MANRTVRSATLLPTIPLVAHKRLYLLCANKAVGLCLSKTILVLSGLDKGLLSSIISDKPATILGSLAQCSGTRSKAVRLFDNEPGGRKAEFTSALLLGSGRI
jgi:hypothetical protein